MKRRILLSFLVIALAGIPTLRAQHSVARLWNEKVLDAIRADFARPTVHARNLFHTSVAMYDSWALYQEGSSPYLIGNLVHGFRSEHIAILVPDDPKTAIETTLSYAVYRILQSRFSEAPGAVALFSEIDALMTDLGYDINESSTDYTESPAALGNYIAAEIIAYGLQDGSNEALGYTNTTYVPANDPLIMSLPGNPNINDLNRWQPLSFVEFIDQGGNPIGSDTPEFLSPEWGQVSPFSLSDSDLTRYNRDGFDYYVYHDPGPPAYVDVGNGGGTSSDYIWGNALVAVWSSHLDSRDSTLWDISPRSIGNIQEYPADLTGLRSFYNFEFGGDIGQGHTINPTTREPYEEQWVKRADYARVLAEFWADGPDSETPPGHWFTILNGVNDHPELEKRLSGEGEVLDDLQWDVKAYFLLGGAMHDAAICAWGAKGWYDYVRPISAIRAMAELGQSSDPNHSSYHPAGLPLIADKIAVIEAGDPLAQNNPSLIGEIKLKAWKGPDFIDNPEADEAGVGWIEARSWFPYQRPSFVTPPFAGYVSGHSTFSQAAAEVLTALTGSEYFPGGMGQFYCPKNEFLVFEDGPSEDITLQWATYRDASDQSSLSRIWGGIHPPVDDVPGRLMGEKVGKAAFEFGLRYFNRSASVLSARQPAFPSIQCFPNPATEGYIHLLNTSPNSFLRMTTIDSKLVKSGYTHEILEDGQLELSGLTNGFYLLTVQNAQGQVVLSEKILIQ